MFVSLAISSMFAVLAAGWLYLGYRFYSTVEQIGVMLGGAQYFDHLGQTGAILSIQLLSGAAVGLGGLCLIACLERFSSARQGVKIAAIVMLILTAYYSAGFLNIGLLGLLFRVFPKPYVAPPEVILSPAYMVALSLVTAAIAAALGPSRHGPKVIAAGPEYADTEPAAK